MKQFLLHLVKTAFADLYAVAVEAKLSNVVEVRGL